MLVVTEVAWIAWLVLLPLAASVASFLMRGHGASIGLASALLNAIAVAGLTGQIVQTGTVTHQLAGWGAPLGVELRADGLACLMLSLTAMIGIAVNTVTRSSDRKTICWLA